MLQLLILNNFREIIAQNILSALSVVSENFDEKVKNSQSLTVRD